MIFPLALRNLNRRRTRSLLTALGIGVSLAVMMAIFALATNFKEQASSAAQLTQADLVAIRKGLTFGGSIPLSYLEDIEKYPEVKRTTGFLIVNISLAEMPSFNLYGVIPEDKDLYFSELHIAQGRYLENDNEIVLGRVVQESLGLGVGDILNLETGEEFEIVGICHTGNAYADNGGIVSLEKAQAIAGRDDKVTLIPIYLNPGADKDKVSQQIEEDRPILEVMTPPKLLEMTVPTQLVDTITWVISLIAAIMGCLGVVTTMSMSVSERMREIGILKTIGWSQFKVWRLILGESLLLSLVGFAIGCLLGVGVTWGIASLPSVRVFLSPAFTPDTFIFGLAMALIFSFLGGIFPAYRAFRLSPAEALRYE